MNAAHNHQPGEAGKTTGAVILIALASFSVPYNGSSVNVALPAIGSEFGLDNVGLTWVGMAFLLASAMFMVPFGRLADIHGRKRLYLTGAALFTAFSLALGLAPSGPVLIALRALQGVGGSMMFATGMAILSSVVAPDKRGRAFGINTAAVYIGLSLGPFLGGILTENLGWRAVFFANVPIGLAILVMSGWCLKGEWAEARDEKYDTVGAIVYALMLVAIMYGFTILPDLLGAGLVVLGILGVVGVVFWERRAVHPVLDVKLFIGNAVFTFSNLAALINYAATFAVTFLLSLYLQYIKALTPEQAGLVLVAQPAMMALFSPIAGRLSDRVEPRILASAGMGLSIIGLVMFVFLTPETSMAYIIVGLVVLGVGFGLFSAPNTNAVMSSVDRRLFGVASGTLATMRTVGQTLSLGISGLVLAVVMGRVEILPPVYPQLVNSLQVLFVVFVVLSVVGLFASLKRGNVRSAREAAGEKGNRET